MAQFHKKDKRMFKTVSKTCFVAGALLFVGTSTSMADVVVSTSASIEIISPPPSLAVNVLQNDSVIFGIVESENLTLTSNVSVNALGTGDFDLDNRAQGIIPMGAHVNSFLLHYDPSGTAGFSIDGAVEFSTQILGVIFTTNLLNESDNLLGSPLTDYTGSAARGFESPLHPSVADFVTVGPTEASVIFNTTIVNDQVRVVTRAIIEALINIGSGNETSCMNINGHGVIPVTILGSESFDVTLIDIGTLSFGGLELRIRGNKGPLCSVDDSDGDGQPDLICHFEDDSEAWLPGTGEATLTGVLYGGMMFEGTTDICIVP